MPIKSCTYFEDKTKKIDWLLYKLSAALYTIFWNWLKTSVEILEPNFATCEAVFCDEQYQKLHWGPAKLIFTLTQYSAVYHLTAWWEPFQCGGEVESLTDNCQSYNWSSKAADLTENFHNYLKYKIKIFKVCRPWHVVFLAIWMISFINGSLPLQTVFRSWEF